MRIFAIDSLPIAQIIDVDRFEQGLGEWVADQPYRVRMLAYSRPCPMDEAVARVRAVRAAVLSEARHIVPVRRAIRALLDDDPGSDHPAELLTTLPDVLLVAIGTLCASSAGLGALLAHPWAAAPATWAQLDNILELFTWKAIWLDDIEELYRTLATRFLRSADYYLITWEPEGVEAEAQIAGLTARTGRPVRLVDALPPLLTGDYHANEAAGMLVPTKAGAAYLAVLRAYAIAGVFDATLLHDLMNLSFDVAIAIDIETFPKAKAMRELELSYNGARGALLYNGGTKDIYSERVLADVEYAMHEVQRQGLHQVQVAVLVGGEHPRELQSNLEAVRNALGTLVRLDLIKGAQANLLQLWSTLPAPRIAAPWRRSTMLSQGVGCLMGVLGYHRARSLGGALWGIDQQHMAPLFVDLFGKNQAAHAVVLGKTGYGKTFFLNMIAIRTAALLGYRVITVDAFKNAARIEAAVGGGAHVNWIDLDAAINPLDIVFDASFEGGWLASQVQHAIEQVALLLGAPGVDAAGRACYIPRSLAPGERGVLDAALTRLYRRCNPDIPLEEMPRLSDLIAGLDVQDDTLATGLADELNTLIYGTRRRFEGDAGADSLNSMGRNFNRPTSIDWSFTCDINCFDFSGVAEAAPSLLPFYYAQAVGAINRFMRDSRRDPARKTLLIVDEFGYAARSESVGRMAADICKVARKYRVGLMAVDQNPGTFLDSQYGREIYENAVAKLFFRLDPDPASRIAETVPGMSELHTGFLSNAEPGQCIAVVRNDVYLTSIQASRRELQALVGS